MNEVAIRDAPITMRTLERLLDSPTIPKRYQHPGDLLAAVLVGRELGVAEMTAINELYLVDGSASMSAKLMLALIFQAGHKVKFTFHEADGQIVRAECQTWRCEDGEYEEYGTYPFSLEDAARAGLLGKDNWAGYPQWMMAHRAMSAAARFVFPDVILGVGYVPEEVGIDVGIEALPDNIIDVVTVDDETYLDVDEVAAELDAEVVDG